MILDFVALGTIVFMAIGIAALIVVAGSLPGKIARKRHHPWPEAVTVAGWIGLATGLLWPLALVWAFLPVPEPHTHVGQQSGTSEPTSLGQQIENSAGAETNPSEREQLQQQIDALTKVVADLRSGVPEVDA